MSLKSNIFLQPGMLLYIYILIKQPLFIFVFLYLIFCSGLNNSCKTTGNYDLPDTQEYSDRGDVRIMFYNTENLFDTIDDPEKNDDEFLPKSGRYWTGKRYKKKINSLYKVIVGVGGWEPPEMIGLCEVENRAVLEDLVRKTPLSKFDYEIVHVESPDERGIDNALLFRKEKISILSSRAITINYRGQNSYDKTRDILYVKCVVQENDTLHVFVNHWPSRWEGLSVTEPKRMFVAGILRSKIDSICDSASDPNIIIMGDFNDEAENKSLKNILKANINTKGIKKDQLYNMPIDLKGSKNKGTLKYKSHWNLFDRFIVSGTLLSDKNSIYSGSGKMNIYSPDFLLVEDEKYLGYKPFRTYYGYKYKGGFSDHLPIYLDLHTND